MSAGIRASKALGQHFLHDQRVLERIAAFAKPPPGSGLLEIGPGTGNLTEWLLAHGGPFITIERDRRMLAPLRERFGDDFELIHGDAARADYGLLLARPEMGPSPVVVGNLPYNAAVPILFRLLEARPGPARIVIMLQKEVARRLAATASTSDYGQLSVKVQMVADVRILLRVGRGAFAPPPKVESAVVAVTPLNAWRHAVPDRDRFTRLLVAGFAQRRKTLARALHNNVGLAPATVHDALVAIGHDHRARAEALSVAQWADLALGLDPALMAAMATEQK